MEMHQLSLIKGGLVTCKGCPALLSVELVTVEVTTTKNKSQDFHHDLMQDAVNVLILSKLELSFSKLSCMLQ